MKYRSPEDYPRPESFAEAHGIGAVDFPMLDTAKVAKHSLAVLGCWAAAIFGVDDPIVSDRLVRAAEPDLWAVVLETVEEQRGDIERYIDEYDDVEAQAFINLLRAVEARPKP